MWYRTSKESKHVREPQSVDEKILSEAATRAAKRRLFLAGHYHPDSSEILKVTRRIMTKLGEEYGKLDQVRRQQHTGDWLTKAVTDAAASISLG